LKSHSPLAHCSDVEQISPGPRYGTHMSVELSQKLASKQRALPSVQASPVIGPRLHMLVVKSHV
jgi:hypothetical protein